jgi:hypothetical protein
VPEDIGPESNRNGERGLRVVQDMDLIYRIGERGLCVAQDMDIRVIGSESVDLVWLRIWT